MKAFFYGKDSEGTYFVTAKWLKFPLRSSEFQSLEVEGGGGWRQELELVCAIKGICAPQIFFFYYFFTGERKSKFSLLRKNIFFLFWEKGAVQNSKQ